MNIDNPNHNVLYFNYSYSQNMYGHYSTDYNIKTETNNYSTPLYSSQISIKYSTLIQASDNYVQTLFDFYHDRSKCISNFNIFKRFINIKANKNLFQPINKNIKVHQYLNSFKEVSIYGLEIPHISPKGNKKSYIFNPTLSSMILSIKKYNLFEKVKGIKTLKNIFKTDDINNKNEEYNANDNIYFYTDNFKISVSSNAKIKIEYIEI